MRLKLILNVLFEKKKILVLFFVVSMVLIAYASIQTILSGMEKDSVASTPDFVFNGTIYNSEDGSYPFKGYNDIGSYGDEADRLAGNGADCYRVVYRSLYNFYDEISSVGFFGAVYGIPDACISEHIKPYIEEGELPKSGKKEAVIGYYFAKRYNIGIGDTIPQAVTLSETWTDDDIDNYTVCGILAENITEYFNGSVIISREDFEASNSKAKDNMILGYYKESKNYKDIFMSLNSNETRAAFNVPEGKLNYTQKEYSNKKLAISLGSVMIISAALLTALLSYLMKGITPKIGLLKAIGVSSKKIISTFLIGIFSIFAVSAGVGLGVSALLSHSLNKYVSNFYQFQVHSYQFSKMVLIVDLILFAFIVIYVYAITFFKCKMISPKIAMAKTV